MTEGAGQTAKGEAGGTERLKKRRVSRDLGPSRASRIATPQHAGALSSPPGTIPSTSPFGLAQRPAGPMLDP